MGKIKLTGELRRRVNEEANNQKGTNVIKGVIRKLRVKKTERDNKRNN